MQYELVKTQQRGGGGMEEENIFLANRPKITLEDYLGYNCSGRGNLGEDVPVFVYRMLEYSLKEILSDTYGKDAQVELFRKAGFKAGTFFARKILDTGLEFNAFVAQLQQKLQEMKIGVMRMEERDLERGRIILTVSEDADCSGLPVLGETVCNYDEGFISGILTEYTGKLFTAVEVDCWATGDRVCRFRVESE